MAALSVVVGLLGLGRDGGLSMLIAAFTSLDPFAGGLAVIVFVVQLAWYAAYPIFLGCILSLKLGGFERLWAEIEAP